MECPHCKAQGAILAGAKYHDRKRIYCRTCGKWSNKIDAPKILLFDIETSRLRASLWRKGEQYIRWQQIDNPPFIISWAGKWLFSPDSFGAVVTPKEAKKRNDKRVVSELHKEISRADLVITHNGDRFDIKVMNWYFIKYGLLPNNRYKSIDTLKEYKKVCAPPLGYSLDALAQELGYNGKIETDMQLWADCEAGNQEALDKMFEYNKNDVYVDEDVNVIAPFTNSQNDIFAQNERFTQIRWGSPVDIVLPLDERFDFELCLDDAMHVNAGLDQLVRIINK
jgi:DNA polymerase elongation subunit (family B)